MDRELKTITSEAKREATEIRGKADAEATKLYGVAYSKHPEFYSFTRSLQAYKNSFQGNGDILLLQPDSEFFRYLKDSKGGK